MCLFFIQRVLKSLKGYIEDIFLSQQTISIAKLERKQPDFANELYSTNYLLKNREYQSRTFFEQGEFCYRDSGKEDYYFSYAIENKGYYCMPEVGDKVYQLLLLEQIDCLYESSEFYPNKTVKRFILDKEHSCNSEITPIE